MYDHRSMISSSSSSSIVETGDNNNNNNDNNNDNNKKSVCEEDLVKELPGYDKDLIKKHEQYSGYLDAKNDGTYLHYWLATATDEVDAEAWKRKPVVLWLNGGPGSSSILGMLQEQGPIIINNEGSLMDNEYAWTNAGVNLIALESPAGVGWSICKEQTERGCKNTDKSTAIDAKNAILDFFFNKFPVFIENNVEFFIAGESYAGVYVPTLAMEIVEHNEKFPLKSINLVGINTADPCTSNKEQKNSMDMLWYGHKYGFVPEEDFNLLWNVCKLRYPIERLTKGRWGKKYSKIIKKSSSSSSVITNSQSSKECKVAHAKFLFSTSNAFSQNWPLAYLNDLSLYGPSAVVEGAPEGSLDYFTNKWMNRADVKKALNIKPDSMNQEWPGPNDLWEYVSDYDACNDNESAKNAPSMKEFYSKLAKKLKRILVLNGDTDPCVSYEGTRKAIANVGFPVIEGGSYRAYFFNATATDIRFLEEKPLLFGPDLSTQAAGAQLGGHVINYSNNLTYASVHGSGHMIPQFRPRVSLHVFKKFISGDLLSPLLPSDDDLAKFDDDAESSSLIDEWTKEAETFI